MSGISKNRLILYGVLLVALLGANLYRLNLAPETEVAEAVSREAAPIRVPELHVAARTDATAPGTRDIFRPNAAPAPKPVVAAAPAPEPVVQTPDPIEIAIGQVTKQLDAVKLVGVLASGEGALAVFEHDGNTLSRFVGDEIVSGFKLDRISQREIRARHDRLGLVAILSLGGVRPMQMTRVE